ncbi:Retrotransposon Copia-like N-terminal [Arabidopsis suecica]|uniref:Retrotransposon Copia-like N-terminal n=1 Tax=Arabidopsis suecica TaxID=45249 RepID=A0A8T2CUE4_ARASU|nr:Retrotransposon Copia-like N-terminal [Arabidopsis suecica]
MANPATISSDPYSNPFYLHAADNSGVNLVTDKLTGESNYHTWRRSIIKALNAKNKLGFINGSIVKPSETDADYGSWTRCNDMVDLGRVICQRFIDQLDRLHQGSLDLNAYYTRLTTLWEELKIFEELPSCTCGHCTCGSNDRWLQLYERRNIVRFLMRLNESFAQTRRQILMMDPLPEFTKIYNFISQDEQQKVLTNLPVPEAPVCQASVTYSKQKSFHQQGKPRPLCTHCGLLGHTIARCYKLHGYPPGYKIPPTSGYTAEKPKIFPQQNGVHMVYSQSPDQMVYMHNPQIQSPMPQNQIHYNGTSYVPIGPSYTASASVGTPSALLVNVRLTHTSTSDMREILEISFLLVFYTALYY